MKCSKCFTENIIKANYCSNCQNEFTKKEKDNAYNKTIYGKLDMIEKWYYRLTLSNITSHIVFKIGTLLIILIIGIYFLLNNGISTKILNGSNYDSYYIEKDKVYYLMTNSKEIDLNIYKPNRLNKLIIKEYNEYDEEVNDYEYIENQSITLLNKGDDYYIFESVYSNNQKENFKVIINQKDFIKNYQ